MDNKGRYHFWELIGYWILLLNWFVIPYETEGELDVVSQVSLPFNSQDLIVNSPLYLLYIFLYISSKNLVLDQDSNFEHSHCLFAG